MLNGLPSLTDLADVGATGLLALTVLLILTGRLVPRSVLRREEERADKWEQAAKASGEALRVEQEGHRTQEEANRMIVDLIRSIQRVAGGEP